MIRAEVRNEPAICVFSRNFLSFPVIHASRLPVAKVHGDGEMDVGIVDVGSPDISARFMDMGFDH